MIEEMHVNSVLLRERDEEASQLHCCYMAYEEELRKIPRGLTVICHFPS